MKILVLNSGSSSVKFQLIETSPGQLETNRDRVLAKGIVEKIGTAESVTACQAENGKALKLVRGVPDHRHAIEVVFECLTGANGVIRSPREIEAVGHRVVHGGERFTASVLITDAVVREIEGNFHLAPLHNPPNIKGYYATRTLLPHAPQVAVFDTAFHQTLPPKAYLYAIPYAFYTRRRIRRYGFHGSSHRYVASRYAQIQGRPLETFKLITCHLGNGCSVCAIDRGKSVETSMGFTPLEGLVMGTRPGDLDSGVLLYLLRNGQTSLEDAEDLLNRQSGLYGISGISNDLRDLVREAGKGDHRAHLALEVYVHRVKKYLGAYYAVLNGADAVIFTGGAGEHQAGLRAMICDSLDALGIQVDQVRNERAFGVEGAITTPGSRTQVWVIPTNEELIIARDTMRVILAKSRPKVRKRAAAKPQM